MRVRGFRRGHRAYDPAYPAGRADAAFQRPFPARIGGSGGVPHGASGVRSAGIFERQAEPYPGGFAVFTSIPCRPSGPGSGYPALRLPFFLPYGLEPDPERPGQNTGGRNHPDAGPEPGMDAAFRGDRPGGACPFPSGPKP